MATTGSYGWSQHSSHMGKKQQHLSAKQLIHVSRIKHSTTPFPVVCHGW